MNPDKLADVIVEEIGRVARANRERPEEFFAWFSGAIVANVVGNLSPEFWSKAMDVRPCGEIGCDCEVMRKKSMELFEIIRNDFLENCVKKSIVE